MAGRATLLVWAADGILGTHSIGASPGVSPPTNVTLPATVTGIGTRQIRRKPVPGGLISDYVRAA
ncbi:MAG: hypothetical protein ACLP5E_02790 [Streptosporangiaceae bacterium]|jgi:hypothetical protein